MSPTKVPISIGKYIFQPLIFRGHPPSLKPVEHKSARLPALEDQLRSAEGKLDDLGEENEKKNGWLGCIGDYTTQLYSDYNEPL